MKTPFDNFLGKGKGEIHLGLGLLQGHGAKVDNHRRGKELYPLPKHGNIGAEALSRWQGIGPEGAGTFGQGKLVY
jgi:hypothetical protein